MSGIWLVGPILGVVITAVTLFFVFRMLGGLRKQAQEEQRLLQTGAPAMGQILAVNQTGTYVNNQPQVQIVVMVHPPGGQPYQAQIVKIVSMFETSQYQIGSQVHVRYDQQNPAKVAIATQQQVMAANPMMMQQQMQQQPGMQQPGMQQPGMQQPGMQQPGMQQPGMQQPGMQQPGMQQPGVPPQGGGYPPGGGGAPPNFG